MYRSPMSWRPPLALGGHGWLRAGETRDGLVLWQCAGCFVVVPAWAFREGFWMAFAGRWCKGRIRALGPAR